MATAAEDTDTQAREIQRDIERTRNEMDQTLSALEERLAPSELVHRGAEQVREHVRTRLASTFDVVARHPGSIAAASIVLGAALGLRPSVALRRRRRAEEDFERVRNAIALAADRARHTAEVGVGTIADRIITAMQRTGVESRAVARTLRDEASTHPLGVFAVGGLAALVVALGARGTRRARTPIRDGRPAPARTRYRAGHQRF